VSAARRSDKEARRLQLLAGAAQAFAEKGVAGTTVSDIAKAAGLAQGTLYLYFASKDDVVNAVVEQMVDGMVVSVERAVAETTGAVARFLALRDALMATASDPAGRELVEIYHRPENAAVHHRMAERIGPRLIPVVERIVVDGVGEGVFVAKDPTVAAWFVLGGLQALEAAATEADAMPDAIAQVTDLALRALGCDASQRSPHAG
jgi:AcrR family transcriptional regulator